mgnify:CR=1 FL=1
MYGTEFKLKAVVHSSEFSSRKPQRTILLEPTKYLNNGARYGNALLNIGDVNYDGNEDFIVGAPYDDNKKGAIYLYLGSDRFWENNMNNEGNFKNA